jgi:GT2 family glycosyltransferase
MIKPISFCIATANNEKEYIKLLLKSLQDHTQFDLHEVIIFVDTDNQGTYNELLEIQKNYSNIKICKNPDSYPVWAQLNASLMFQAATKEIFCYIQSDMVVGKDFDKHVTKNLTSENVVLSCARIEPPLHPASPEKIVKSFGTSPEDFDYQGFNKFVDELQKENRPNIWGHFAPFAMYKKTWFDKLGGFDQQFRSSREDSDLIIRMGLNDLDLIQSWNACVYHFTCVSSRGKDWFKSTKQTDYKNSLQSQADAQELKRFIRKWGMFGHHAQPVYDIAFNIEIDRFVDFNLLKWIEPYCKTLYISDNGIAQQLISQIEFEANYYNNLRWGYSQEYWDKVRHIYNSSKFEDKIQTELKEHDIVISCKLSELMDSFTEELQSLIINIHQLVDQNEIGEFGYGPLVIKIHKKNNLMDSYKKHSGIPSTLDQSKYLFN